MLRIKGKRINQLLQILHSIENDNFSKFSFSKNHNIALRTLERNIKLLIKYKFIYFEGHSKTGKYKITEKYKKLKKIY